MFFSYFAENPLVGIMVALAVAIFFVSVFSKQSQKQGN